MSHRIQPEHIAVIKLCSKLEVSIETTKLLIKQVYRHLHKRELSLMVNSVSRWHNIVKAGREDIYYETYNSEEAYDTVKDKVAEARKMQSRNTSVAWFTAKLGLPAQPNSERAFILQDSNKDVLYGCVVPRKLTREQKQARYDYCEDIIDTCTERPEFLESVIVGSLTWFRVRRNRSNKSATAGQEMIRFLCFYNSTGILYKQSSGRHTIEQAEDIGEINFTLIEWLKLVWEKIVEREECINLLLDRSLYSKFAVRSFCAKEQVCILSQPPHSPDLSPCHYFLFDHIREQLPTKLLSCKKLKRKINSIMGEMCEKQYKWNEKWKKDIGTSILKLKERAEKCKTSHGDYVRNNE